MTKDRLVFLTNLFFLIGFFLACYALAYWVFAAISGKNPPAIAGIFSVNPIFSTLALIGSIISFICGHHLNEWGKKKNMPASREYLQGYKREKQSNK